MVFQTKVSKIVQLLEDLEVLYDILGLGLEECVLFLKNNPDFLIVCSIFSFSMLIKKNWWSRGKTNISF